MTVESNRQDIVSIQILRGIAALMVVFVHIDVQLERLAYPLLESGWLASGVDIFFVISGFIMWVSVEQKPGMTAAQFMRNRVVRIVPLYWLLTSFLVAVALVAPQMMNTTVLEPGHAIRSYLFIPDRHPNAPDIFWPVLIPGWTLNFEMAFYALFALAIAASGGSSRRRLAWIAALLVGTLALAAGVSNRLDFAAFYANPIILEFLAGVLIGIAYRSGRIAQSRGWFAVLALGFVLLWLFARLALPSPLSAGLPATLIVAGALFAPPIRLRHLQWLGDVSYSLYLSHVITLAATRQAWTMLGLDGLPPIVFILAAVAATIAVAGLVYRLAERPMLQAMRPRKIPRERAALA